VGIRFPAALAAIHDPPPGLFLRGRHRSSCSSSRRRDRGRACVLRLRRHVARSFARAIAAAGVVVLSGLARGVDGWAHRGALDAGGLTVAVLGCGIDRDYPRAHAPLAARICERGLIVSEYPPGVAPAPWRFPARNRIVAGLALATVVVEARERSGALITADLRARGRTRGARGPGEITSSLSAGRIRCCVSARRRRQCAPTSWRRSGDRARRPVRRRCRPARRPLAHRRGCGDTTRRHACRAGLPPRLSAALWSSSLRRRPRTDGGLQEVMTDGLGSRS
jgi:DNA protecting protein DprA